MLLDGGSGETPSQGSAVDCDLSSQASQTTTSTRNREDAKETRDKSKHTVHHHKNPEVIQREPFRAKEEKKRALRENTYLDIEVFGVVEHGFEGLGLNFHITDFDFLDLARLGRPNLREGSIQCCL